MGRELTTKDGVRIHYVYQAGEGPTLVFLHGAGGDLTAWTKERAFFHEQGYPTLAIDLRGHGLSDRPDEPGAYTLAAFAEDVLAVCRAESIREPVLVGHCFGGIVATACASLKPAYARGYVLLDTSYATPPLLESVVDSPFFTALADQIHVSKHFQARHNNYARYIGTGDWNAPRILSDIQHTSLTSWIHTYQVIADFDTSATLKDLQKPTLIIEGQQDSIFPLPIAQKIHRFIRGSRLTIVPGANHILVLNNPVEITQAMQSFFTRHHWHAKIKTKSRAL